MLSVALVLILCFSDVWKARISEYGGYSKWNVAKIDPACGSLYCKHVIMAKIIEQGPVGWVLKIAIISPLHDIKILSNESSLRGM